MEKESNGHNGIGHNELKAFELIGFAVCNNKICDQHGKDNGDNFKNIESGEKCENFANVSLCAQGEI